MRKRPGAIVRMIWKVKARPKRMHISGINGEGVLRGQAANPSSPGKMAVKLECLKRSVLLQSESLPAPLCLDVNSTDFFDRSGFI